MGLGDKLIRQNYSYKDFINDIGVILGGASMYLKRPERIELREIAYVSLQRVEDFYAKIPFHALQDIEEWREVFNNMSKIKETLATFRQSLDAVFEKRSREAYEDLNAKVRAVIEYFNIML